MLMNSSNINYAIIKHNVRVISMWRFATDWMWSLEFVFVESGLKLIFHCTAHSSILEKSLFSRLTESLILWTTESSDVSSAKSLAFEFKSLGKSLINIKDSKGRRIDPWGTKCWNNGSTKIPKQILKYSWSAFNEKLKLFWIG